MKSKIIVALLLMVTVAGVVGWRVQAKKKQALANRPTPVAVTRGIIERTVEATGEVTPLNRVEIKPPISGRVEDLKVEEGSQVKRGQIIGWMSSSDRAAILDAALAQGPEEQKKWEDAYKPTPIVAPLSGVVILKNVVVGQTVDSSIIMFAMSDRLIVKAQVDEADIGRIKLGLPARIALDAYPDDEIKGRVTQILYEGKNVSNVITYGVKIAPDTVPPFFRSQMTANVTLVLEQRKDALLIPAAAVHDGAEGKHVMVPGTEKPERRSIETGLESNGQVEVTGGLNEGDIVLVWQKKYSPQKAAATSPLAGGAGRSPRGGQPQRRSQ
jgi:macrolide-specific efflux system membrane fusion protein